NLRGVYGLFIGRQLTGHRNKFVEDGSTNLRIATPEAEERAIVTKKRSAQEGVMMSALGQKQTYAVQNVMSALPPIATAKADFPQESCPLYPRKRTCAAH